MDHADENIWRKSALSKKPAEMALRGGWLIVREANSDAVRGRRLLKRAAQAGDLDGQTAYGLALIEGLGGQSDLDLGFDWLLLASKEMHWAAVDALTALVTQNPSWIEAHVSMATLTRIWTEATALVEFRT